MLLTIVLYCLSMTGGEGAPVLEGPGGAPPAHLSGGRVKEVGEKTDPAWPFLVLEGSILVFDSHGTMVEKVIGGWAGQSWLSSYSFWH